MIDRLAVSVRFVKKAVGIERRKRRGERVSEGGVSSPQGKGLVKGLCPLSRKFFIVFHFKIVHYGALTYTSSKVVFAI